MPRGLLLLSFWSVPAWAQAPDVAPPAPEELPEPLGSTRVWEQRRGIEAPLADLAVEPGPQGAWLVIGEKGGVWRSEDQGRSWTRVVDPVEEDDLPNDEEILLEAETRREEAQEEVESETVEVPTDPTVEELPEAEDQSTVDDAALEEAAALTLEQHSNGEGAHAVVWFDPAEPGRAFAGREDGLWRSDSSGRVWERIHPAETGDPAVTRLLRARDGSLLLGTTDGVRVSLDDGSSWLDTEDATDGAEVADLAAEAGRLWAATDRGLFTSTNGLSWDEVVLPFPEAVRVVVIDPVWETGFWVATPTALYRTDDGGNSWYMAGRQPMHGLRRMVHLDEAGHLFATSSEGILESMDGGVTWNPADRRLDDPDVRGLGFADTGPVVVTRDAVWWMIEPRATAGRAARDRGLSLNDSIRASIERPGLSTDLLAVSRGMTVARFAPQLELDFDWSATARRANDNQLLTTVDTHDSDWSLTAKMCWGSCSTTVVVSSDGSYDYATDDAIYVQDGQVWSESDPVAAAANVAQSIRSYRRYLSEHVADAWLSRRRLSAELPSMADRPLKDQVLHVLQIQELDARLDAMTEGAFTRSSPPSASEESP